MYFFHIQSHFAQIIFSLQSHLFTDNGQLENHIITHPRICFHFFLKLTKVQGRRVIQGRHLLNEVSDMNCFKIAVFREKASMEVSVAKCSGSWEEFFQVEGLFYQRNT